MLFIRYVFMILAAFHYESNDFNYYKLHIIVLYLSNALLCQRIVNIIVGIYIKSKLRFSFVVFLCYFTSCMYMNIVLKSENIRIKCSFEK